MKTIDYLMETSGRSYEDIAARANLAIDRVAAIAEGRWTPSPEERAALADAFEIPVAEISWGHSMSPRVIRYGRFGLRENF